MSVIEAWRKGVSHSPNFSTTHTPGTEVDVFSVDADYGPYLVRKFLDNQIGKKYDFKAIARFLTRRDHQLDDRYFCSELVFKAFVEGGCTLLKRIPASHVSPRDLVLSPYLCYVQTITTE